MLRHFRRRAFHLCPAPRHEAGRARRRRRRANSKLVVHHVFVPVMDSSRSEESGNLLRPENAAVLVRGRRPNCTQRVVVLE